MSAEAENDLARTLAVVLKPQKPEPYSGTIDAEAALNFVDSFEEYYTILKLHVDCWVAYVVLSLTLDARSWWRTSGLDLKTPWSEFRTAFLARFTPPDSANKARGKLRNLKQGRQSVAAYTTEFRRYLRLIPTMHKDDALYEYLRGLEDGTGLQVRLRQPDSLDAAITEATIVHAILLPDGVPQAVPQTTAAPRTPSDPTAMEIDNLRLEINALRRQIRNNSHGLPPLDSAERARLRQRGACYKCRRDGHMYRDCPDQQGRAFNNMSVPVGSRPNLASGNAPSDQA
jgi:hypothetical protein